MNLLNTGNLELNFPNIGNRIIELKIEKYICQKIPISVYQKKFLSNIHYMCNIGSFSSMVIYSILTPKVDNFSSRT